MQLYFLGTNGWFATNTGETSCTLIETNKFNIILDIGSGIKNIKKININKNPIIIFLSHLHYDHIEGIHSLSNIFKKENIIIYVHKCYLKKLKFFFSSPFTKNFLKYKNKIQIKEFNSKPPSLNFVFKKLKHSNPCFGFRFVIEKKIISYCTDTSDCKNIDILSKNSDILIIESNNPAKFKKTKFHLNSIEAINIGIRNFAKKIALMHFDPINFDTISKRNDIKKLTSYNNRVIVTKDKMNISL